MCVLGVFQMSRVAVCVYLALGVCAIVRRDDSTNAAALFAARSNTIREINSPGPFSILMCIPDVPVTLTRNNTVLSESALECPIDPARRVLVL